MKQKYISILLVIAIVVIVVVVVFDRISEKPGSLPENAFEYNIDEYAGVPDSLISHREVKQISIKNGEPAAVDYFNGGIYLAIDNTVQAIDQSGKELFKITLEEKPVSIAVAGDSLMFIAFKNYLSKYNKGAIVKSRIFEGSQFSSLDTKGEKVFVADAGKKQVKVFDNQLNLTGSFDGESGVSDKHGFIIPSLHFDLCVNGDNELWVVNPGLHAIQNYTDEGKMRGFWSKTSFYSEGFSGCCNPFYIDFLSDGSFVTSEKGLVRVKIHKASGEFSSVVAPPSAFGNNRKAPGIAVDENDNIIVLDTEKRMLRFFAPKNKSPKKD